MFGELNEDVSDESILDYYDKPAQELLRGRDKEDIRQGDAVTWVGSAGEMLLIDPDYALAIEGNTFDEHKLASLVHAIENKRRPTLFVGYGTVHFIDADDVEENRRYDPNGYNTGDGVWQTERPLDESDIGKLQYTIRDGNHRTFAALIAGETKVWILLDDNQLQDVKEYREAKKKSNVRAFSKRRGPRYTKLLKALDLKLRND